MTKEEITSSKISKAFFQNNNWNVSVSSNKGHYHVIFYGEGTETNTQILERVFIELQSINTNTPVDDKVIKEDLINQSPIEKK